MPKSTPSRFWFTAPGLVLVLALGCSQQESDNAAETAAPVVADSRALEDAIFGISIAEAREIFPEMRLITGTLGAAHLDTELQDRFLVEKPVYPALAEPVDAELRFWDGELWTVVVFYRENETPTVIAHLEDRFGPQTGAIPKNPVWNLSEVSLNLDSAHRWYGISDNARSAVAREWLLQALKGG